MCPPLAVLQSADSAAWRNGVAPCPNAQDEASRQARSDGEAPDAHRGKRRDLQQEGQQVIRSLDHIHGSTTGVIAQYELLFNQYQWET